MKQREFFTHLIDRIASLSVDVASERHMRLAAERRLAETPAPQIDPRLVHDMIGAIAADRKIDAIRAHRALTGYGLKESKDAIETITSRMGALRAA